MKKKIINNIKNNKIFFIGGSGFIGKYFFKKYKNKSNLIITYNNKKIKNYKKFNIFKENLSHLIKRYGKPKTIIYAITNSNHDFCFKNQSFSNLLNVKKAKQQINIMKNYSDINFIFLSSQMVLSGQKKLSNENCKASPKIIYGKQKLEVENYIKENIKNYTILRLAKVYGVSLNDKTILTTFLNDIIKGKKIYHLAYDQYFNPLFVGDLVKVLSFFHKNKIHGETFHVGGPNRVSRYNLIKYFYNNLNKNQKRGILLKKRKLSTFFNTEDNPLDTSFDVNKLESIINFKLTSYKECTNKIIKKLN